MVVNLKLDEAPHCIVLTLWSSAGGAAGPPRRLESHDTAQATFYACGACKASPCELSCNKARYEMKVPRSRPAPPRSYKPMEPRYPPPDLSPEDVERRLE